MVLKKLIEGSRFRVMLTPRAYDDLCGSNLRQSQDGCTKDGVIGETAKGNKQSLQKVIKLLTVAKKYADATRLKVPEHMNDEGDDFYAFKSGSIRAYWWQDRKTVIISHFVIKKSKGLAKRDKELMEKYRRQYYEDIRRLNG